MPSGQPNDGGPAFPIPMVPLDSQGGYTDVRWQGMTLREYYAGQALVGLMIADVNYSSTAEIAVKQADALIAELRK